MVNRVLVIDDDRDINLLLQKFLTKHGFEVQTTTSGAEGEKLTASFKPQVVLSDYRLDDTNGATLLPKIKAIDADIQVIIITGYSDLQTAVRVMRKGAFDYITKPLIPDEVLLAIRAAFNASANANGETSAGPARSKTKVAKAADGYLMTDSPQSKALENNIALVAPTNYSVIIYGESGAGKEGVARLLHERSTRRTKPFIAMDCGAISKELAGSELFGHEQGAFTGAVMQKAGHFEKANGGTVFLDEVGNLPMDVQTILLRVIQERVLRRIGGSTIIPIDVRIIVASNEKLPEAVRQGKFREDLYHRLNEFTLEVPPLRTRKQDIMFFANHFLTQTAAELQKTLDGFTPEVENVFLNYPWYGNIRELKNVIKRAALLSTGYVTAQALPEGFLPSGGGQQHSTTFNQGGVQPAEASNNEPNKAQLKKAHLEGENEVILNALKKANFNKTKAAELLGIDRKTLYNKMKQIHDLTK